MRKSNKDILIDLINKQAKKQPVQEQETTREDLLNGYKAIQKQMDRYKAYKVTFEGVKDLVYVSFQTGDKTVRKGKAMWEATKFFKENFHPVFLNENMLYKAKPLRVHELDKYGKEGGVIPIPVLMETLGMTFKCSACGTGKFDLEDYEMRRCYVTEEFNFYPFAKGVVLCKSCFEKYMGI